MPYIVVHNNTNHAIASCISMAGVNYSWCNRLNPGCYYVHNAAGGSYHSLTVRSHLGKASEFESSAADIGLYFVGTLATMIGFATGGIGLALEEAAALAIFGTVVGGVGAVATVVGAIYESTQGTWTNISATQERKFVVDGTIKFKTSTSPNNSDQEIASFEGVEGKLKMYELRDKSHKELMSSGQSIEHKSDTTVNKMWKYVPIDGETQCVHGHQMELNDNQTA